ncbi:MAG TPA: polysaccharide deacetylase family protein [Candidatus Atribacteria bacterium]|nr:polysaccharide deacetylase family protein [Candidatus Atribacteria bacterium]HPT77776.1 polysaccharide deacetylase family protein [Candidatus Atribacteria bacterium]
MKVIYISKSKAVSIMLCLYLVLLSFGFMENMGGKVIGVFLNIKKELPIYSVETEEKKIAISFDAAWGAEYTSEIMDIVEARDIKTTFFLVRFWIDKYPDKVREIAERGHEVANHSATHPHMASLSKEQMISEIVSTQKRLEELAGDRAVRLFRPPFGEYNDLLIRTCRELDIHPVQWDVDSLDWQEKGVDHMYNRVVKNVRNGSIVLFHNNAKYITQALPLILDKLLAEGYKIVPVSELIHKGEYRLDHTGRQIKIDS